MLTLSLRRSSTVLALLVCAMTAVDLCGSSPSAVAQESWTRFRGANGNGISDQKGIPTTWSPGDYAWNIELPGVGHASPIVWKDKLFVTSAIDEGALRFLFCLNAATGKEIWSRQGDLLRTVRTFLYSPTGSSTGSNWKAGLELLRSWTPGSGYLIRDLSGAGEIDYALPGLRFLWSAS